MSEQRQPVQSTLVSDRQYKPGEVVPTSGIYEVVHDKRHTQDHEITAVRGEKFPPCNGCGQHPRFKLRRAAHHITEAIQYRALDRNFGA